MGKVWPVPSGASAQLTPSARRADDFHGNGAHPAPGCARTHARPTGRDTVAALCTFSDEVVADSNANVLDGVGGKMVRSVALEADRAMPASDRRERPAATRHHRRRHG